MNISGNADLDALDFAKGDGLIPVVAQHARTGEVLMLGYASREALECTLESGELWFFSRAKGRLWKKGETSGNVLRVEALDGDCDADAVLARVIPAGPTCHTGARSCFGAPPLLAALDDTIASRAGADAKTSYTARLLGDRNVRLKKLGEEASELVLACADANEAGIAEEAADLVYHALVACRAEGVSLETVLEALAARRR